MSVESAVIQSSTAAVHFEQGRVAEALREVEAAVALQPTNSVARLTRSFAWMASHQWERVAAEGEEWTRIWGLVHLGRGEEAAMLARQRVEKNAGVYYRIQTGEWISGESILSRVGYSTDSRGVLVTGNPRTPFGWTIDIVETRLEPGLKAKVTGRKIPIYTLVWVYETITVDNQAWVRIGLNEWAEKRLVGRVFNNPTPPQGVTNGRWIEINLYDQTISVYQQNRMVFAALIASGIKQMATRPGLFQVTKKVAAEHMSGAFEADRSDYYYLESVPWTMYFDEARAIHGVYWRTSFGRQVSHGCVNMSVVDSRWMYDWAKVGEWVYAWDEREQKP